MSIKTNYVILFLLAVVLSLGSANADVSLRFNNLANNQTNGTPATISATPGQTITLTLQLSSTTERTDTLDYWLSQFSGPTAGAISINERFLTGSAFGDSPSSSDLAVAAITDLQSNSAVSGPPDGIPDNQLNPRNAFNLGAGTPNAGSPNGDLAAGTFLVATYDLLVSASAAPGTYVIRTFDYAGRGWSDVTNGIFDQAFTNQAEIHLDVVPEPATWSLLGIGAAGLAGLRFLRRRRQ